MEHQKKVRSTSDQLHRLINYMATHRNFASGLYKDPNNQQWGKLKSILKAYGPDKSIEQWKHTWRDLRRKAREEKLAALQNSASSISTNSIKILDSLLPALDENKGNDEDKTTQNKSISALSRVNQFRNTKIFASRHHMLNMMMNEMEDVEEGEDDPISEISLDESQGDVTSTKLEDNSYTYMISTKKKPTKVRCTSRQINMLVNYMSSHPEIARPLYKGPQGKRNYDAGWFRLKQMLRSYGPDKSVSQWKGTWRDLRRKGRDKVIPKPELSSKTLKILSTMEEHSNGEELKIEFETEDAEEEANSAEQDANASEQDANSSDADSCVEDAVDLETVTVLPVQDPLEQTATKNIISRDASVVNSAGVSAVPRFRNVAYRVASAYPGNANAIPRVASAALLYANASSRDANANSTASSNTPRVVPSRRVIMPMYRVSSQPSQTVPAPPLDSRSNLALKLQTENNDVLKELCGLLAEHNRLTKESNVLLREQNEILRK